MENERFICIWQKDKNVTMCSTDNTLKRKERLYIPKNKVPLYNKTSYNLFNV